MWNKFGKYHSYQDLLSMAVVASLEAEKSYNPMMAKFSAYVKPRIEGAIIRGVSNVSTGQHKVLTQMYAFIDKYVATHDRIPAQHIILKHLEISEATFLEILDSTLKITEVSTDDVAEDVLIDTVDLDVLAEYHKVSQVIETLPKKKQQVIKAFMEDSSEPSAQVQEILDIIRTKLKIKEEN